MTLQEKFTGTGVALVTPFTNTGEIDHAALEKIVHHVISGGLEYLVVLGTTGESATLSKDEKKSVIETVKKTNNSRVHMMLGIGGNNTRELVEQLKTEDLEGFDAVLSVSPYYNKPNQQGIINHYSALADASPLPVLLYNVPGRTGSNLTAETTLKLSDHKNILGIKEASGNFDQCMEILKNKSDGFLVVSGDDAYTLPLIACGMKGVISVVANAYPRFYSDMVRAALANDYPAARPLHYKLTETIKLMFADGSPGGVKQYLNILELCSPEVRMPLSIPSETIIKKIKADAKVVNG